MIEMTRWFEREFPYRPAIGSFATIVERLRGAPARAEEKVVGIPAELLTKRIGDHWSIQEKKLLGLAEASEVRLRGSPDGGW